MMPKHLGTVIITGGAKRLGLAAAKSLCKQGFEVVITFRNPTASIDELLLMGVRCVQVDFTESNELNKFIALVKSSYLSLRAIIHNASDWDCENTPEEFSELFDRMMNIHAKVPYLINLAFESLLVNFARTHQVADVIHMTDFVVERGSDKHIAYAASKAALTNLTLSFAKKLAPKVKVNAIAPALLMFNEHDSEVYKAKALKKSLMQIEPGSQELVNAINFILSSQYLTGRTIALDGGRQLK